MQNIISSLLLTFPQPVTGELALLFALAIEQAGIRTPGQWGSAYFRYPYCGEATDCNGEEVWDDYVQSACLNCDADLFTKNLRISEGWIAEQIEKAPLLLTRETYLLAKLLDGAEGMIQEQGEESLHRYWDVNAIREAQKLLPNPITSIQQYQLEQLKRFADRLKHFLREDRVFKILDQQDENDSEFTDWTAGGCLLLAQCLHQLLPMLFQMPIQLEMLVNSVGVPEHVVTAISNYGTPLYLDADGLFTAQSIIRHWEQVERRKCSIQPFDAQLIAEHEIVTSGIKHEKLLAALKEEFCS